MYVFNFKRLQNKYPCRRTDQNGQDLVIFKSKAKNIRLIIYFKDFVFVFACILEKHIKI